MNRNVKCRALAEELNCLNVNWIQWEQKAMRTKDQNQAQCKLNCKLAAKELVVEEKLK